MKFVKSNPAKSWKLWHETLDDGTSFIHTGYVDYDRYVRDEKGQLHQVVGWDYTNKQKPQKVTKEVYIEEIENFVFEASLYFEQVVRGGSTISFSFHEDINPIQKFSTSASGMEMILKELAKGNITLDDSHYKGIWTFKKQGTEMYIYPYMK